MAPRRPPSPYDDSAYERERYQDRYRGGPQSSGAGKKPGEGLAGLKFNMATIALMAGVMILGIGIGTAFIVVIVAEMVAVNNGLGLVP